jgi:hypothetical protein
MVLTELQTADVARTPEPMGEWTETHRNEQSNFETTAH